MSDKAQQLAARFEQANQGAIAQVEACSDQQWQAACDSEGRPVGVLLHHVAGGHPILASRVQAIADNQPHPPTAMEWLNEANALHARQHADCTRPETLDLLRRNGETAASVIRGLDDSQLQRSAVFMLGRPPMTVEQVIEYILIGHIQGHLATIRQTLAAS